MTYKVDYNPTVDDLYVFPTSPTVWPTYGGAAATRENPNLPLKNQIVYHNNIGVTYDIDFSGVSNGLYRQLGAAFSCPTCFTQNEFPYCNTFWNSAIMGGQGPGNAGGVGDRFCDLFDGNWSGGGPLPTREPYKSIRPEIVDANDVHVNGKYWNDVNLWRTNTFQGAVLLDTEDNDAEVYLWGLGHPMTTRPCDFYYAFTFLDRTTNTQHTRYFTCPCKAWGLPLSGQYTYGLNCNNCCDGRYAFFTAGGGTDLDNPPDPTSEANRLFVMAKTIGPNTQNIPEGPQQPLPNTIKRYKILLGSNRKNWPVFALDSNYRFIRGKTTNILQEGVLRDRDITVSGSIGIGSSSLTNMPSEVSLEGGEGDDGVCPRFTISDSGETIVLGYSSADTFLTTIESQYNLYNQPLTSGVPTPCVEGQIFLKEGDKLKFNTYCAPALFHPELVIPNYPNNDIRLLMPLFGGNIGSLIDYTRLEIINTLLEELGKPKIKTYIFPENRIPTDINFPDIYESAIKYPLFESPYSSRESKNSFFKNTNLIDFNQKKMLQASELNELQEKFYRNESLFIEYINKWFTKENINYKTNDLLGFSEYSDIEGPWTKVNTNKPWICSKAIPFEKNKITFSASSDVPEKLMIKLNPCKLMINSVFYESSVSQTSGFPPKLNAKYNNIDFIEIQSDITGEIDLTQIEESNINAITLKMDINNLISCNEYSELKDNSSSDINEMSPCGAGRNYISTREPSGSLPNELTIIQQTIPKNGQYFNNIDRLQNFSSFQDSTPFNQIAWPGYMVYLLGFALVEDGRIYFYHANGIPIDN